MRNRLSNLLLASMMSGVVVIAPAVAFAPAALAAAGNNCSAAKETKAVSGLPDPSRVRAACSSLSANTKAKGILDLTAANDYETQWFTRLNTNYYSGYATGPNRGVGMRTGSV